MQMLVPPTRQILLVLLFLPLKALKHWNLLRKSRSNKTQQIMPQNKKKRNHRNTNNAKCVESFIWFWRDFVFYSPLYIFSLYIGRDKGPKGSAATCEGFRRERQIICMYLFCGCVCMCVWYQHAEKVKMYLYKYWTDVNVKRGLDSVPLFLSPLLESLILSAVHLLNLIEKGYTKRIY